MKAIRTCWVVLAILAATITAFAQQQPLDIGLVIMDMQNVSLQRVRQEAATQASPGNSPIYPSTTEGEVVEFLGQRRYDDSDKALVIFSDDGCDVIITEVGATTPIVNFRRFWKYQHLPDLDKPGARTKSFWLLSACLERGKTYNISVKYGNRKYTGYSDIDGCTLFLFNVQAAMQIYRADSDHTDGRPYGALVPDDDEATVGSFTVANLNNTDGDNISNIDGANTDVNDDNVIATAHGRNEMDLMRLILERPVPPMGGNVRLTIVRGNVKIWASSTKGTEITSFTRPLTDFTTDHDADGNPDLEWWVEARSPTDLRGIELKYEYILPNGRVLTSDRVTATAVWAQNTMVIKDNLRQGTIGGIAYDEVDDYVESHSSAAHRAHWIAEGAPVRDDVIASGGTGARPEYDRNRNVIVFEFRITPNNIASLPEFYPSSGGAIRARPLFDVSRHSQGVFYEWPTRNGDPNMPLVLEDGHEDYAHFPENHNPPRDNEYANDDARDTDEEDEPTAEGYMWCIDTPGGVRTTLNLDRINFREFVRVRFDNRDPGDDGNTVSGSRCSSFVLWYTKTTVGPDVVVDRVPNELGLGNASWGQEALATTVNTPVALGGYETVSLRGLSVASTAGNVGGAAVEEVDLFLGDDDGGLFQDVLARYDGRHIGTDYDIHRVGHTDQKPRVIGKLADTLVGDITAYTGLTLIGTGIDAEIVGYNGGSDEGQADDAADVFHSINTAGVNPSSPVLSVFGTRVTLLAPTVPNPLVMGNNNVTATGLWVNASAYGGGAQNVTLKLREKDNGFDDDRIALETTTATRPANAIKGAAVQVNGGAAVTFVVMNVNGTILGNDGTNEANENPVRLYYRYDSGKGEQDSPHQEVNVDQPSP